MKKILIIAKLKKLRLQPSLNTLELLEYLGSKENITLIEDEQDDYQIPLNIDLIIYYCLSNGAMFGKPYLKVLRNSKIKKVLFFEDLQYIKNIKYIMKKSRISLNLRLTKTKEEEILKNENIKFHVWNDYFFLNHNIFKNYNQKKEYDILLYGAAYKEHYPLRFKIKECLIKLKDKYKIKIIEHPGYKDKNKISKLPKQDELSILINKSKFCISTRSNMDRFLYKYQEIPLSNSVIIGDIPTLYKDLFRDKIVEIDQNYSEEQIMEKLKDCCEGKYDYLLNDNQLMNYFKDNSSFELAYNKLNEL